MKLAIFATHPVQYHVPLWRGLAQTPGLDVTVYYFSDHSVRGGLDPGFGAPVKWDVPMLEGYEHAFLSREADLARSGSAAIDDAEKLLREGGFERVLIQGYTYRFERQAARAARRLGIRVVMRGEFADSTPRSAARALVRNVYLKWFYRHVDAFCFVGQEAERHLRARGIPQERMFFSPYSVDTALFEGQMRQSDRAAARAALGLAPDTVAFLFSGKLIPRKDPLLLLQALERLSPRERVALIVVGDGELKEAMQEKGSAVLGSRFLPQGFVNQSRLGAFFAAADVFVLPSHSETWGLVVNEAMQFALPVVVSSHVGCHLDLVLEGRTGFVFQDGDVTGMAAALDRFLRRPTLAAEMGRQAREHIQAYSTAASVRGIVEAIGLP